MSQLFNIKRYFFVLLLSVSIFQSCKTDEFKFGEITIKEDWDVDVISPLFTGKGIEFRDFIYDWKKTIPNLPGNTTILEYSTDSCVQIPTQLIFDQSAVIDSFPFYIQGSYLLSKVDLEFTVINSCPFPLNLKLEFFSKSNPNKLGPAIVPQSFYEANFQLSPVVPDTTIHRISLDSLQLESFNNSDRMKFTSWFEPTYFINQNDTISAHYPVDISIVLIGVVQGKR